MSKSKALILICTLFMATEFSSAITGGHAESSDPAVKRIFMVTPTTLLNQFDYSFEIQLSQAINSETPNDALPNILSMINLSDSEKLAIENFDDLLKSIRTKVKYTIGSCSGAFINDRIFITAKHCLEFSLFRHGYHKNFKWQPMNFMEIYLESPGFPKAESIKFLTQEPFYLEDIAFIKFPAGSTTQSLPVANNEDLDELKKALQSNKDIQIQFRGFGINELPAVTPKKETYTFAELYEKGNTPIDKIKATRTELKPQLGFINNPLYSIDTNSLVHAVNYWTDSSQCGLPGDSGGPVIWNGKIIGVNSRLIADMNLYMKLVRPEKPFLDVGDSLINLGRFRDGRYILSFDNKIACAYSLLPKEFQGMDSHN